LTAPASSDTDGEIISYDWDFGDGSTGTGADAAHAYDEEGSYTVSLAVTDDKDAVSDISTAKVIVTGPSGDGSDIEEEDEEGTGEEENIYDTGSPGAGFAVVIDEPVPNSNISSDFQVSGWAADMIHASPKKWVKIEMFSQFQRSHDSYLGQAVKFNRPDLCRANILDSGYVLKIDLDKLESGAQNIYIYIYDSGGSYTYVSVPVTIIKEGEDEAQPDTGGDDSGGGEEQGDSNTQDPVTEPITNSTSFTGYKDVSAEQLVSIFNSHNPSMAERAARLAPIYIQYGQLFDIRADIAWAQMCHETGFLAYTGDVQPQQNNFAGIGATGGVPGNSFATEELGIIAHYAHLAWYYYSEHVNEYCSSQYDPRHFGSSHYRYTGDTTLGFLNGQWAPGSTYTNKIIQFANEIFGF